MVVCELRSAVFFLLNLSISTQSYFDFENPRYRLINTILNPSFSIYIL